MASLPMGEDLEEEEGGGGGGRRTRRRRRHFTLTNEAKSPSRAKEEELRKSKGPKGVERL